MHAQINEHDILKQFWELEEQPRSTKSMWSEEEQKCEEIFTSTTKRTTEGRYIVKLPFRDNQPRCLGGGSRKIAVTKFKALEKRLSKDLELKKNYTEVINEYLQLGHMRRLRKDNNKINEAVYLPHHAVVRKDKTTTKVRVVFNASSKNNYGVSLNETLMIGPTLQADLRHLVMRWRIDPIVLVADVIKMYRQVRVAEDNTKFQRIVWRENPESEIEDFELLTVTFGIASAPYLAVRVLNQISLDEGKNFPLAAPRVLQAFYMDDLMTGCCDVKEGLEVYKQMTDLLARGGFKLQKWNSNNEELLSQISINEKLADMNEEDTPNKDMLKEYKQRREMQEGNIQDIQNILKLKETESLKDNKEIEVKTENTTKILGISWDRREDHFRYSVNLPKTTTGPETKRTILSIIARLYDPLGWIAPSIILAKMLIQRLWLAGTSWDELIPADLLQDWNTYRNELPQLTSVRVPRWLGTSTTDTNTELHGFCDASKSAYAAVVYLRVVDCDGNTKVSLLTAKTRVAPIKQISIPRLELCGAVLLTQLLTEVAEVLNINKRNIKAWIDSTVVLAWLNSHPSRWKTFVANRVSKILTSLNSSQWYHVSTKENPADCASRGVQPEALAGNALWFFGPNFLREKTENIPYKRPMNLKINLEEAIKSHINVISDDAIFQKFSSLQRLLRVIAYCRRFNRKNKCTERKSYLTKTEIDHALMCCIKKVQKEEFGEEYLQLKEKGLLSKSSKLKSLCPYLDNNDIMRVSGRLQNSQLPAQTKYPIILPHSAYFTKLVISEAHQNTLHGGVQLMVNYLRTMYWIIGVKNLAKQHVRRCVTCVRQNAKVQNPFMGSLPAVRCTPARAFLHSGVDYAGPINIRTTKGRGHHSHKGYICLFICMSTRAIHLEAVNDMSTQAFLAAFRRFVARRGHCTQIWSDNGTTFVGASRELEQLKTNKEGLATYLESHGTEWHFIPPHAPNFGGLWEAGVKSTKLHLKRVIGESTLTFEEMSTLLSQIEACLNSRPITVDSSDPSDPLPLTPGHFLIGGPLIAVPEFNDYLESNISSLKRWQFIQQMLQHFWRRWSQEYLSNLMNRYKWSSREPEPNIGDVVLVKEDNLPPSRWLMGRIVEKHPGIDNVTRVVTIRTKSSFIKRPTSKLCVLPVRD
ncbi:unnamed protein product [Parnassius mnemosyne]